MIRFMGRAMCCRAGAPPPLEEAGSPYALLAAADTKEEPILWRIEQQPFNRKSAACNSMSISCVAGIKAICEPIEGAMD